jgi:glutamate/aspartate transport system substrate-binding protein
LVAYTPAAAGGDDRPDHPPESLVRKTVIAAAVVSFAAFAAQAQTLADVKKRGALRLGYSETSVPFAFKNNEGQPSGYSVELCQRIAAAIATRAGTAIKVEWVPLTPSTRLDAVATGKVDLECGTTTITLARREKVDFSLPIFVDASTLMARGTSGKSLAEMQGKKIAAADGTTTLPALERALNKRFIKADIVKTKSVAEGFDLLKEGKVDALASDRVALVGTFLQGGGAEGLGVFSEDLSYEPYALVMRKNDTEFRLLVDRVLAQIYRNGEIEAIYGRWLGPLGAPSVGLLGMYMLNSLPE